MDGAPKPNFLVIGVQKSGTTWLYDHLRRQPGIFLPRRSELHFFQDVRNTSPESYKDYLVNFEDAGGYPLVGERTSSYFWTNDPDGAFCKRSKYFNNKIPETILDYLGRDTRILVSLRNPVERAVSAYFHHAVRGRFTSGTLLRDIGHRHGIVDMGFYARHLRTWRMTFSSNNIFIVFFERDIVGEPYQTLKRVCQFLGYSRTVNADNIEKPSYVNKARIGRRSLKCEYGNFEVFQEDVQMLLDVYTNDVEKLSCDLGECVLEWLDIDIRGYRSQVDAEDVA